MKNNIWITLIVAAAFIVFIMYIFSIFMNKTFYSQEEIFNKVILELKSNKCDTTYLTLDNKINILKYNIEKVEEVNNKRIEVLGWSFVILSSFVTIILGFNIVNHKSTIRDMVKDEFNRRENETISEYNKYKIELNTLSKQYSQELQNLRNNINT